MRRAAAMVAMVMACGPEQISHGDGTGSAGDSTTTDGGSDDGDTSSDDADTSTGESPTPPIPGEGPYGAGTRLKPVVERTEDGVTQLVYWYDGELGIDCEFVRDSVGTPRCLPLEVEGVTVGFGSEDCTEPALGISQCASAPTHVRTIVPGAADCAEGARHQAYLRAAPIGSGGVGAFSAFHGDCAVDTFAERHALTAIPDEQFVAATAVLEVQGDVQVRILVAEDGAYVRDQIIDPRSGTVCLLAGDQDGSLLCGLPWSANRGYADDTCSMPLVAYPDDGTCDAPAQRVTYGGAGVWNVLGDAWDGSKYELEGDDTCSPLEPLVFEAFSYRTVVDTIDAVESPRFERASLDEDPGRVRRGVVTAGGQPLVLSGVAAGDVRRWFDTLLGQVCEPAVDDDGVLRCFPLPFVRADLRGLWGDADCSATPLLETSPEPASALSRVTWLADDGCIAAGIDSVQNVVGLWEGPVYRLDDDGACALEQVPDGISIYQLGNYALIADAPVLELVADE